MKKLTKTIELSEIELSDKEIDTALEKNSTWNAESGCELVDIDYRDEIDAKGVQKIILEGVDSWYEDNLEWISDSQYESVSYIIGEIEKEKGRLTDDTKERIRERLLETDNSDVLKDLMRNTSSMYFFYDTGMYIDEGSWSWEEKEIEKVGRNIAKRVGIEYKKNASKLSLMVRQAVNCVYGGSVCVLFEDSPNFILDTGDVIEFENAHIAIMNRVQGSGDYTEVKSTITLPYNKDNLYSDEGASGYSLTGDVFGLTKGFMSGAVIRKAKKRERLGSITDESILKDQMSTEREYEKRWKEGKCSFGDMNIKRHKSTPYRNDYPCGNKCEECSTFWID